MIIIIKFTIITTTIINFNFNLKITNFTNFFANHFSKFHNKNEQFQSTLLFLNNILLKENQFLHKVK